MNKDVTEVNKHGGFTREYRFKDEVMRILPSQKRIKVGLLIDGDAKL